MWDEDTIILGVVVSIKNNYMCFGSLKFCLFSVLKKSFFCLFVTFHIAYLCVVFLFSILDGRVISPDDFHWHSHGGRAMGHMVDLQSHSFSHGKILLGSFMKKPSQVDLDTVSVSRKCLFISVNCITTIVTCSHFEI